VSIKNFIIKRGLKVDNYSDKFKGLLRNTLKKEKDVRIGYKKSKRHRTATTTYPCSLPGLGGSAGAGRAA